MDSGLRKRVWDEIGEKMEAEGERCKARWNNLRDNYKKSLKKLRTKNGEAGKSLKRYRFADQLSFLDKYFNERETKGNINMSADDDFESEDEEEHDTSNTAEQPQSKQQPIPQDVNNKGISTGNISDESDSSTFSTPRRHCKKRKLQDELSASSILMKYIIEKNSARGLAISNRASEHLQHPVDAFLFGISPMLKSLSPYYLSLAKSEIFATAHKYEMMMLTEQSTRSTTASGERAFQPLEALPENVTTDPLSLPSCSTIKNSEDNL
ncbi:uncharacterized protein [Anabrus simplex]|uniref:uncharacterized protein n=1 Tax=Anabrus simplex TaxID=316456 RepID=UPI0035A361EE